MLHIISSLNVVKKMRAQKKNWMRWDESRYIEWRIKQSQILASKIKKYEGDFGVTRVVV